MDRQTNRIFDSMPISTPQSGSSSEQTVNFVAPKKPTRAFDQLLIPTWEVLIPMSLQSGSFFLLLVLFGDFRLPVRMRIIANWNDSAPPRQKHNEPATSLVRDCRPPLLNNSINELYKIHYLGGYYS